MQNSLPAGEASPTDIPDGGHGSIAPGFASVKAVSIVRLTHPVRRGLDTC